MRVFFNKKLINYQENSPQTILIIVATKPPYPKSKYWRFFNSKYLANLIVAQLVSRPSGGKAHKTTLDQAIISTNLADGFFRPRYHLGNDNPKAIGMSGIRRARPNRRNKKMAKKKMSNEISKRRNSFLEILGPTALRTFGRGLGLGAGLILWL